MIGIYVGKGCGFALVAEYSTNALLRAIGRLTDADSFPHGLKVLIANYGLLSANDAFVISWCDQEKGIVEELFASAFASEIFPSGLSRPLENTGAGYFLNKGPSLLQTTDLDDLSNQENIDFKRYRNLTVNDVVGAPIIWRLQVIGVVQLLRRETADFRHLEFIEQLAILLAPHLALARSTSNEEMIRDRSRDLTDLAGLAANGAEIHEFFSGIGSYLRKHIGFDAMTVRIRDGVTGMFEPAYQQGVIDFSLIEKLDEPGGEYSAQLLAIAAGRMRAFTVGSGMTHDKIMRDSGVEQFFEHVPSILVAPLWRSGDFVGTIECYSLNEGAYGEKDIYQIEQLAELALHRIVQYQLTTEMNRQLHDRESLAELARISVSETVPNVVMARIGEELSKILTFDHITFYLPDPLVTPTNGFPSASGDFTFSAVSHSKIENISHDEIESVTGSLVVEDQPLFTVAEKLSGVAESETSYIALSSKSQLPKNQRMLFKEAARHVASAVNYMMLNVRSTQLIEERKRALQAETDVLHFQEVDKMKKEILSTVTHEIRTPLTSITAFTDILSRNHPENLTKGQLDNLEVIRRGSLAVSNIISDLDELVSLEPSNLELMYEEIDLTDMIRDLERDIRPLLEPNNHQLRLTVPRHGVSAVVDRIRLAQVLSNLVNNAAKYSPDKSIIRLLMRVNNGNAHFFVKDQGEGIPGDEQSDLFQLFTRARSQRSGSVRGSGIGLYVCEKIVHAHGGLISLQSVVGEGTTIHFWIPLSNTSKLHTKR
ncbi:HAMP domain-containing histidine kinase [Dehalococcoides mccartyi]|nr:HAMP domain-containing histidine kinase [Dehalococcoides mccartyi]